MTLGDNTKPLRGTISEFQKALASAIDEAKALKAKTDELAGQLATPGADADVISAFVTTQNQRITQAVGWIEASGM
ncbi:MAG: hypothetical protein HC898_11600 [Phycisphaerales bacterium]|nr:hypothetical protein [Phycisphaerales bacterium]